MSRTRKAITNFVLGLGAGSLLLVFANHLPAGFGSHDFYTTVEIDGQDFGRFDQIAGLEAIDADPATFSSIKLSRDFVTDPSLYLWAKRVVKDRSGRQDVHLVTYDEFGQEVKRSVLKLCQPLSWTVETSNTGLGGFNESVELAVQSVSFR